jgi:DNA primase
MSEEFDILRIQEFVPLERSGNRYKCCCPIHNESKPSLVIYPNTNSWFCFGCNQGGDLIEFVRLYKGLASRGDAYEELTGKKFHQKDIQTPQEHLVEFVSEMYSFILNRTKDGQKVLEYIKNRGFTEEEVKFFKLGYSNGVKKESLIKMIQDRNEILESNGKKTLPYDDLALLDCGFMNEKLTYDLFCNRLLFPLYSEKKVITGFTGRSLKENDDCKYLNSKEGLVFKKVGAFFNYENALPYIKASEEVIICEGTFDAMSYFVSGKKNVLATCGVALSKLHLAILKRYAKKIILAFDNDSAGIKSVLKTARIVKEAGFEVSTIVLKSAKDANEYMVKFGREKLKKLKESSIYFYIYKFVEGNDNKKIKAIFNLLKLENEIEKKEILKKISKYLDLSEEYLIREYSKTVEESTSEDIFNLIMFSKTKTTKNLVLRILDKFLTTKQKNLIKNNDERNYAYYNAYNLLELCFKFIEVKLSEEKEEDEF